MKNYPGSIIYNYKAKIVAVNSCDSVTALIDCGFRNHMIRQFRLASVPSVNPRKTPRGMDREAAKLRAETYREILEKILGKSMVLISPEKPAHAGTFASYVFMEIDRDEKHYCVKFGQHRLFDVCAFMRDVCTGVLAMELASTFIQDVKLSSFHR